MRRINQAKTDSHNEAYGSFKSDFIREARLNVNDLMKKRQEERKVDKSN